MADSALQFYGLSQKDRTKLHFARGTAFLKLGDFHNAHIDRHPAFRNYLSAAKSLYLAVTLNEIAEDAQKFRDAWQDIQTDPRLVDMETKIFVKSVAEIVLPNTGGKIWKATGNWLTSCVGER